MQRDADQEQPTYRRARTSLEYDIKRASAVIVCTATSKCQRFSTAQTGTAFLVSPELIATCAHVLDIADNLPGRAYQITRISPPEPATNCTLSLVPRMDGMEPREDIPLSDLELAQGEYQEQIATGQIVYCLKGTAQALTEVFVSEKKLAELRRGTSRHILLTFPVLGREPFEFDIPAQDFHDTLLRDTNADKPSAPDAADEKTSSSDPPALRPAVWAAFRSDCALIQLPEEKAIWEAMPLALGTGVRKGEKAYLYGFPTAVEASGLLLDLTVKEAATEYPKGTGFPSIACEAAMANFGSEPQGFSGGPIVSEDGFCVGLQIAIIPTKLSSGGPSAQFGRLYACQSIYLQRLLSFRLELNYRRSVYPRSLRALSSVQRKSLLRPMVIGHPSYPHQISSLVNVLDVYQEPSGTVLDRAFLRQGLQTQQNLWDAIDRQTNDIEPALMAVVHHMHLADIFIICVAHADDTDQAREWRFQQLRLFAHKTAIEQNVLAVWCAVTPRKPAQDEPDVFGLEVSEALSIEELTDGQAGSALLHAWTAVVHRIHLLLRSERTNP